MGRRLSLIARVLALTFALLTFPLVWNDALAADESHALVLVGGKGSHLSALSPGDVRRLYLGRSIQQDRVQLVPLRNTTDPLLYETFLQKVLFMSAQSYEHHLLARIYQTGGQRPPGYDKLPELERALQNDPGSVTFMWRAEAQAMPGITIIQELSQEPAP